MLSHGSSPLDLLSFITLEASSPSAFASRPELAERRPVGMQDPLVIAAATSAGSEVTRNHYFHDFFPPAEASRVGVAPASAPAKVAPVSYQAPRRERLARMNSGGAASRETVESAELSAAPSEAVLSRALALHPPAPAITSPLFNLSASTSTPAPSPLPPLEIECLVRTRIPTPHGAVFLHLYRNNHDAFEHLAFVADRAQMESRPATEARPYLRSRTLDREWREGETGMERIVRGAYVGRLGPDAVNPSAPGTSAAKGQPEPALVRIHSECFTGEVIGSQRCDCGEQLDEAMRLITEQGHGVVVYLRQEGRGIGLLEKMRAYNLQDLGHDTVTANLLLGHGADLRTYGIAGAILHDLGVDQVKLLTNNPDKIAKITSEGVKVVERVEMVPRTWGGGRRKRSAKGRNRMSGAALLALAAESISDVDSDEDSADDEESEESYDDASSVDHSLRRAGVGMIGGSTTRSVELDKYLRTKVERMGHMLAPPTPLAENPARRRKSRREPESPLTSSVASLAPSDASGDCGSGCEECQSGSSDAIEYVAEA